MIQTYSLSKRAHKMVENKTAKRIITPPIVGVPAFLMMCPSGPSSLIGCPPSATLKN